MPFGKMNEKCTKHRDILLSPEVATQDIDGDRSRWEGLMSIMFKHVCLNMYSYSIFFWNYANCKSMYCWGVNFHKIILQIKSCGIATQNLTLVIDVKKWNIHLKCKESRLLQSSYRKQVWDLTLPYFHTDWRIWVKNRIHYWQSLSVGTNGMEWRVQDRTVHLTYIFKCVYGICFSRPLTNQYNKNRNAFNKW